MIGIKVGMTQVFDQNGVVIPVTVIKAGPCVVLQKKMKDPDGYESVQLGLVEFIRPSRVNKPRTGHFKKAGVPPCRILREFRARKRPGRPECRRTDSGKPGFSSLRTKWMCLGPAKGVDLPA